VSVNAKQGMIALIAIALLGAGVSEAHSQLAVPQRVRVSSGVAQGLLIKKVDPEYPREAREQHIQGMVVLKVEISKEGDVVKLELISGDPVLAPAAIQAVKQWKYKPYLLNGVAVIVETQVSIAFQLQLVAIS